MDGELSDLEEPEPFPVTRKVVVTRKRKTVGVDSEADGAEKNEDEEENEEGEGVEEDDDDEEDEYTAGMSFLYLRPVLYCSDGLLSNCR